MSYEYFIQCNTGCKQSLFGKIYQASLTRDIILYSKRDGLIRIKDTNLPNSWDYDIQLKETSDGIDIALIGWSTRLYKIFKNGLLKQEYKIRDEDTEEFLSLEELFRITA